MLKQIYECDNCGKECDGGNVFTMYIDKTYCIAKVGNLSSADICPDCIEAIENALEVVRFRVKKAKEVNHEP